MTRSYESFGRTALAPQKSLPVADAIVLLKKKAAHPGEFLAFGNGRSYGDSCHNSSGRLIDMSKRRRVLSFEMTDGIIEAEAGMLLADMIPLLVQRGFFLPVVPGTQFVTLGGAIANDVHGKNHHLEGTFGRHVEWFDLLRSDGNLYRCSPSQNRGLYAATIGGMGLTGLILSAAIRLKKVGSANIVQRNKPFRNLREYFDMAEAADAENEFAVAWVDQLASGAHAGRGVLLTGNYADGGARIEAKPSRFEVKYQPPVVLLNRPMVRAFNTVYRWRKSRGTNAHVAGYQGFFFPLDAIKDWNRLYGPRGLFQHQSVVPLDAAAETLPAMLEASRKAGQASFLTVLKRFGAIGSPGLMSFPRPGYTLTLDFANLGERTLRLLDELDAMVVAAGGAVNPYKDARMSPRTFDASFSTWRELEALRDPAFVSDFWRRTAGRLGTGTELAPAAE